MLELIITALHVDLRVWSRNHTVLFHFPVTMEHVIVLCTQLIAFTYVSAPINTAHIKFSRKIFVLRSVTSQRHVIVDLNWIRPIWLLVLIFAA